jgi:hypothetical protein
VFGGLSEQSFTKQTTGYIYRAFVAWVSLNGGRTAPIVDDFTVSDLVGHGPGVPG